MAKSPTLRRLFDLDAGLLLEGSPQWALFREKLQQELKGIPLQRSMPDLMAEVAELFDIPISDVFIASWRKSDALNVQFETSRRYPDGVSFFSLSEHTVTSEFHPSIEIKVPGKLLKTVTFTTRLSLSLDGFNLRIKNGRITHINAGRYGGTGSIHYGELELVTKEFEQQEVPMAIEIEG